MVCIALSVPVGYDRRAKQIIYLSMLLVLKIWEKGGPSKLEIAHDLLLDVKDAVSDLSRFVLLMDFWYPKAPLLRICDEWKALKLICAVRSDTALYDLPPARTGKRGRPRKRGIRLSLTDFNLKPSGLDGYLAGRRPVLTHLFGDSQVTAFVTCPTSGNGTCRLYLSTLSCHEAKQFVSEAVQFCEAEHEEFISLMFYRNRWAIEMALGRNRGNDRNCPRGTIRSARHSDPQTTFFFSMILR